MNQLIARSLKAKFVPRGIRIGARERLPLLLFLVFLTGMIAGCSDYWEDTVGPVFPGKLSVTPKYQIILAPGDTQRITITGTHNGRVVDMQWMWSSMHPQVATVDSTGLVTGRGSGKTTISAESRKYPVGMGTLVTVK